jgi:hypothetical protein
MSKGLQRRTGEEGVMESQGGEENQVTQRGTK